MAPGSIFPVARQAGPGGTGQSRLPFLTDFPSADNDVTTRGCVSGKVLENMRNGLPVNNDGSYDMNALDGFEDMA